MMNDRAEVCPNREQKFSERELEVFVVNVIWLFGTIVEYPGERMNTSRYPYLILYSEASPEEIQTSSVFWLDDSAPMAVIFVR